MRLIVPALAVCALGMAANADPVIFDQSFWSGENLLSAQIDTGLPLVTEVADDFMLDGAYYITDVHWIGGFWNGSPVDPLAFQISFYDDLNDCPGNLLYTETTANLSGTFVGIDNNGSENFEYSTYLADPLLTAADTKYWISVQGIINFPPQYGWSGKTTIYGDDVEFRSEYFGFPDWVDGSTVFGTEYDVVFWLTGTIVPAPGALALLGLAGLARRRRR